MSVARTALLASREKTDENPRRVQTPVRLVPTDGLLRSDAGMFDESALTGEPLPVQRDATTTLSAVS